MIEEMKKQTEDLLAYYPGRGKLALGWLVMIPVVSFVVFHIFFGTNASVSGDGIPAYMFYMAGNTFSWVYKTALVVMLIRVCHSNRTVWRESVAIMGSSAAYALMVGTPCSVLALIWLACCVGTSAVALMQVLAGLVLAFGALALLIVVAGFLAHRFGLVIPLLLFLTTLYVYLLPIVYPASIVPIRWQSMHTFGVPLSPSITIIRQGMLNQGLTAGSFWLAALFHAVLGYGLAFWILKRNIAPATAPYSEPAARSPHG